MVAHSMALTVSVCLCCFWAAVCAGGAAWSPEIEQQLAKAKAATIKSLNLMHQRWEFHSPRLQFLLVAANMPKDAWDIAKLKVAKKYVHRLMTAKHRPPGGEVVEAEGEDGRFLMIFGGSSVGAGHDNYHNQSFAFVCERRMRPTFEALNVPLLVRNIAHGQNPCRPFDLCYNAMGGDGADWMLWEQSYNCGRDRGAFELMSRVAHWNKALMYYSASGGFSPGHCPPSNDSVPWISEQWNPETEPLFKRDGGQHYRPYAPNRTEVLALRDLLHAFYEENNSGGRFADGYGPYKSVAAHGFSLWARSKALCKNDIKGGTGCNAMEIMGDCQGRRGGVHWMTKEASVYGAHPDHHGAQHHPPAGMHVKRGEFIAYNLLHAVLDAMYVLETDLKAAASLEDVRAAYDKELAKLQGVPFPAPGHCGFECATRPICYTDFKPHFNPNYTFERAMVGGAAASQWKKWVKTPSGGAPHETMGYQDYKIYYQGHDAGASLHLRVRVSVRSPYLRLCAQGAKESLKHAVFFLDPNVTLGLAPAATADPSFRYTPPANKTQRMALTKRKYVGDECTLLTDVPPGDHVLTVMVHPEKTGRASTSITHLILYE